MWKWLVVIAIAVGGYFFFSSESGKLPNMDETAETLTVTKGDTKVVYNKKQPLQESYMIFGVGHSSENDFMVDGFIAGIPWKTAQSLLRQYPDLTKCNSRGSTAAKNAMQSLYTVNDSDEVGRILKEARKQFDEAIRVNGSRFCLKVRGLELAFKDVYHKDVRLVSNNMPRDMKLIHVEKIMIEPCQ